MVFENKLIAAILFSLAVLSITIPVLWLWWYKSSINSSGDDGASAVEVTARPRSVIALLSNVWPAIILAGVANGMLLPLMPYISLNFFAQAYTNLSSYEIHCDLMPDVSYCKQAVTDNVKWTGIASFISSMVHFSLGPTVGVLSDAYGRKPVIALCGLMGLLPHGAIVLFVFCNVSLFWWYGLLFFTFLPWLGVWFALLTDLIDDPGLRATGFGYIVAAYTVATLVGMASGLVLSLHMAVAVSMIIHIANVLYMFFGLRESLPQELRKAPEVKNLMPVAGLSILMRNSELRTLCAIFMISQFAENGLAAIGISYWQKYLAWDRSANTIYEVIAQISVLAWVGILLQQILKLYGEVGLLFVGQATGALFCVGLFFCNSTPHIFVLAGVLSGAAALTLPATAALKGGMVALDEQGHIQGAVQGVKSMAACLGPVCFAWLFNVLDASAGAQNLAKLIFLVGALLHISTLPVIAGLPRNIISRLPTCSGEDI